MSTCLHCNWHLQTKNFTNDILIICDNCGHEELARGTTTIIGEVSNGGNSVKQKIIHNFPIFKE